MVNLKEIYEVLRSSIGEQNAQEEISKIFEKINSDFESIVGRSNDIGPYYVDGDSKNLDSVNDFEGLEEEVDRFMMTPFPDLRQEQDILSEKDDISFLDSTYDMFSPSFEEGPKLDDYYIPPGRYPRKYITESIYKESDYLLGTIHLENKIRKDLDKIENIVDRLNRRIFNGNEKRMGLGLLEDISPNYLKGEILRLTVLDKNPKFVYELFEDKQAPIHNKFGNILTDQEIENICKDLGLTYIKDKINREKYRFIETLLRMEIRRLTSIIKRSNLFKKEDLETLEYGELSPELQREMHLNLERHGENISNKVNILSKRELILPYKFVGKLYSLFNGGEDISYDSEGTIGKLVILKEVIRNIARQNYLINYLNVKCKYEPPTRQQINEYEERIIEHYKDYINNIEKLEPEIRELYKKYRRRAIINLASKSDRYVDYIDVQGNEVNLNEEFYNLHDTSDIIDI